jgi:TetR/AcrR family transcriptional regulator, cholesterol catabolism regulator
LKAKARSTKAPDAPGAETGRRPGSKKREREILDAAAEIFHRQGYAETSVQDVADAVGILKGSLYYYIDSKEDLLYGVLSEVHDDARVIVDEVAAMDGPPLERLHEYIRRHVAYNTHNLTKIGVFYHDFNLVSDERRRELVRHRKLYENFVTGLIEEAQERGDVDKQIDPKISTYFILGGVNWIYTWYSPKGPMDPEELGELFAELSIRGLIGGRMSNAKRKASAGRSRSESRQRSRR